MSKKTILIVGNSITYHRLNFDIGWDFEWGMAASCAQNDYYHLLKAALPNYDIQIISGYDFEKNWKTLDVNTSLAAVEAAKIQPEIVIMRISENVETENDFIDTAYKKAYLNYIKAVAKGSKVILTTAFWQEPKRDKITLDIGKEISCPVVILGDIGNDESNTAKGLFANEGVAMHPNDKGMREIYNKLYLQLIKII